MPVLGRPEVPDRENEGVPLGDLGRDNSATDEMEPEVDDAGSCHEGMCHRLSRERLAPRVDEGGVVGKDAEERRDPGESGVEPLTCGG